MLHHILKHFQVVESFTGHTILITQFTEDKIHPCRKRHHKAYAPFMSHLKMPQKGLKRAISCA